MSEHINETELRLDAPSAQTFEVDVEKRTITGLVVPYGVEAVSNGQRWQFSQGTLKYADVSRVKLWVQHKPESACGVATTLDDRPEGMFGTFKVARGAEGDKALSLAEDQVLDGFSVGIGRGGKFTRKGDVNHAVSAPVMEVSLTPAPSFDDARVHAVAASAAAEEGKHMTEENKAEEKAVETQEQGPDFSAADRQKTLDVITEAIKLGFDGLAGTGPEKVAAKGGGPTEVNEESLYRFDGLEGKYDFSTDLIGGLKGDGEAYQRVVDFMTDAFTPKFDVDSGNVTTLNPSRQRPDMYVDERKYSTPFYDAMYSGALTDITPFVFPRFNAASGLVADHVEGVEPTPGAFSATSQTVTPSAVSGKVEITREVWDQGGSPQVSGLIWNKMVYAYYKALEAKAVAILDAATPTGIPLTAGATDDDLVNELEAALADLQFQAGGNVFTFAGTHIDLYKRLAAAVDSTGRKLLPILGPTNANGQATPGFKSLDVAGTRFTPAWSLGATGTVEKSSYLVDTDAVHVWNSAPKRLEFEYRVAYIDLAIWGYVAAAISDLTGVREIKYDPTA